MKEDWKRNIKKNEKIIFKYNREDDKESVKKYI